MEINRLEILQDPKCCHRQQPRHWPTTQRCAKDIKGDQCGRLTRNQQPPKPHHKSRPLWAPHTRPTTTKNLIIKADRCGCLTRDQQPPKTSSQKPIAMGASHATNNHPNLISDQQAGAEGEGVLLPLLDDVDVLQDAVTHLPGDSQVVGPLEDAHGVRNNCTVMMDRWTDVV